MWEPFGAHSANNTGGWISSPNERGTLNILSTCILTLILCAYTSLHLNIPQEGQRGWTNELWRRTLWVCIGSVAPEYLAYVAFRESVEARNLEFRIHYLTRALLPSFKAETALPNGNADIELEQGTLSIQDTHSSPGSPISEARFVHEDRPTRSEQRLSGRDFFKMRLHPWTRVHSHFALMGGFAFDFTKEQQETLGIEFERLTLTPVALRLLAEDAPQLLPDIPTSSILDKSKANYLAKFRVCTQAVWFLAQTIGRLAAGFPIILLEFNTGLHALCSLIIYLAWWEKPLDIEEPHLISVADDFALKVCAWMMVMANPVIETWQSFIGAPCLHLKWDDGGPPVGDQPLSQEEQDEYRPIVAGKKLHRTDGRPSLLTASAFESQLGPRRNPNEENTFFIYTGQSFHGFVLVADGPQEDVESDACILLLLSQLKRYRLAQSLRLEDIHRPIWHMEPSTTLGGQMLVHNLPFQGRKALDSTLHNWRHKRALSLKSVLISGLLLAGFLYGGLHLFAWNGPFATTTERNLWRASCVIIASPLPVALTALVVLASVMCLYGVYGIQDSRCKRAVRMLKRFVRLVRISARPDLEASISTVLCWFAICAIGAMLASVTLLYLAARVYLIVECFINLAHLPDAIFQEPEWSQYIPHFGAG